MNQAKKPVAVKIIHFPYIALALGVLLLLIITRGSQTDAEGITALPLLTLLIINECAFFLTLAGSIIGIKHWYKTHFDIKKNLFYIMTTIICVLLTLQFILLGLQLWPL